MPPPTRKLDCYTGNGGLFWGYVKILPDRRYWASDSVWAGGSKGTGRLKPLKRRRFRAVTGPLKTMYGRWWRGDGGVRILFSFGGSSSYNDKYCVREEDDFRARPYGTAARAFRAWT